MLAIFRQLTDAEKLRKVVVELVDTERTYVKHLSYLMQVTHCYPDTSDNNLVPYYLITCVI